MASSTAASSPLSSAPASVSSLLPTSLVSLADALLAHVCSFLSTKELLITIAHTAKATRDQLTPACFATHTLELNTRDVQVLSAVSNSSSRSLESLRQFHARVLRTCRLHLSCEVYDVRGEVMDGVTVWHIVDCLDLFPACRAVRASGVVRDQMPDSHLYALLHHPTVLTCDEFELDSVSRIKEPVPTELQWQAHGNPACADTRRRITALKRHWAAEFDWAHVRLPALTRLSLRIDAEIPYSGGHAFLTAHTGLLHLDVSEDFVSLTHLTAVLQDPAALPQLTRFGLWESKSIPWEKRRVGVDVAPFVTALATTAVGVSGKPRPVQWLTFKQTVTNSVFAAAAPMSGLIRLLIHGAAFGWLQEWSREQAMLSAFPLLEECTIYINYFRRPDEERVMNNTLSHCDVSNVLPFFQSMARRPIQLLSLEIDDRVTFNAPVIAELTRCHQLRDLYIGGHDRQMCMDWHSAVLDRSAAGCLPCLRRFGLRYARLSAGSIATIAAAAPQLQRVHLDEVELTCHPAIVYAILGGYCEHIEDVDVLLSDNHVSTDVKAADVIAAYQSAVAAAEHIDGYKPFTRVRSLQVTMCWCTPASVWHALLSLLRHATRLCCVAVLAVHDPLVIGALTYLPSLTSFAGMCCLWPEPFVQLMVLRNERTGRYRYVKNDELSGSAITGCAMRCPTLWLTESRPAAPPSIGLRPHSNLFTASQHLLSADLQAVLVRWAKGDFRAGDELLTSSDSPLLTRNECADGPQHCSHPHGLHYRDTIDADNPGQEDDDAIDVEAGDE